MHPRDCPSWEYERVPNAHQLLLERSDQLLLRLRADPQECSAVASDTRKAHADLYVRLTPAKCDYYAGHYRGESYRCLLNYRVEVPSDPLVGTNPDSVLSEMAELETDVIASISELDTYVASGRSRVAKLLQIVRVAARIFIQFLTTHPYANGNGHAGRLIVIALLGRYGFWMKRWTVEPRPLPQQELDYADAIYAYRRGRVDQLEKFILADARWR